MNKLFFAAIPLTLFLAACSNEPKKENTEEKPFVAEEPVDLTNSEAMMNNMPSPIELAILIKAEGAKYNKELLNDVKNISKYTTNAKKAINIGVYSADVGYTTLFKQTQETYFYFNNIRKLSDEIGLSSAFDQSMFDRVEANVENRDSLIGIITQAYQVSNKFLKDNNRMSTSVLMVCGAWVECMYIATRLSSNGKINPQIAARVAEQKITLGKLISTMNEFKTDENVAALIPQFQSLKAIMEKGEMATPKDDDFVINEAQFNELVAKVAEVRGSFVN
ncbi:MAG: hypothetical protein AB7G44_05545 [Bacteroidia bacterium]